MSFSPLDLDRAFLGLARSSDDELDLGMGALLLARHDYPRLRPPEWLDRLDALALAAPQSATERIESLTHFLYREVGLRGNRLDYYDIRNSYLHEVLDRKLGIPITLATVVLEVARRLGHSLQGVGFPRHFLVQVEPGETFLDPFDGGRLLDRADCRALFEQSQKGRSRFKDEYLEPVTSRTMLVRMLHNMLGVSIQEGDAPRVRFCLDGIVTLLPEDPGAHLQRGKYLFDIGDAEGAIPDFEAYLELSPHDAPRRSVEDALREAVRRGSTIH